MFEIKRDSFWGRKLAKVEEQVFERADKALEKARDGGKLDEQSERMLREFERKHKHMKQERNRKESGKKPGRK